MTRLFVAACIAATLLAACGGNTAQNQQASAPAGSGAAAPTATSPAVDPAIAATVTGKIKLSSDPYCQKANPGLATETEVVGSDGAVGNVFVYVKDGLGDRPFTAPSEPVVLDQKGCHYAPHVLGIQIGQPLQIVNSDDTLHNVHGLPKANKEFNQDQPIQGMKMTHTFSTKEVMIPFKCDVHGWMNAWIGVLDHPYYAVTSTNGTFSLKGLPPGTYTIEAWHEKLGTQTQTVTVGEKETKDVAFTFKT